jgi:tetratricopeptide (TPR) repeat protein
MADADGSINKALAEKLKQQGNAAVASKNFAQAVAHYSQAIAHDAANHILFSNRSGALLDMGKPRDALSDANHCIELAPTWPKGHFRRGLALERMSRWQLSSQSYQTAMALDPTNTDIAACKARVDKAYEAAHDPMAAPTERECIAAAALVVDLQRLTDAATTKSLTVDHLITKYDKVKLVYTADCGRSLTAAVDIPAFTEILEEPGLAWVGPFADVRGHAAVMCKAMEKFPAFEHSLDEALTMFSPVATGSAAVAPADATSATDASKRLPPTSRFEYYYRVMSENALGCSFDDSRQVSERNISVLAPVIAMCNHSCKPTAGYTSMWDQKQQCPVLRLHSWRDIKAGEPITIAYVDTNQEKLFRMEMLRQRYGFECSCERCAAEHDDTIVFNCPKCNTGRIFGSGTVCQDCAWALDDATKSSVVLDGDWDKQRNKFSKTADDLSFADLLTCAESQEGSSSASVATGSVVHLTDARRLDLLYDRIGSLIQMCQTGRAQEAAMLFDTYLAVLAPLRPRYDVYMYQLCTLAGHVHALAGTTDRAKELYGRAVTLYTALYGPSHPYTLAVTPATTRIPKTVAEIGPIEQKRIAAGSWQASQGLPTRRLNRWLESLSASDSDPLLYPGEGNITRQLVNFAASIQRGIERGLPLGFSALPEDAFPADASVINGTEDDSAFKSFSFSLSGATAAAK